MLTRQNLTISATTIRQPVWILALRFLVLILVLCFSASVLRAHPIHLSLAEADYRPESGKLEIALRLFSDDAETVLSARTGKKITIEKTPAADLDHLFADYVKSKFIVKTAGGSAPAFTWIGHELKDADQHVWLYFECAFPGGVDGARFASRVMREEFSDQLNSVLVRDHTPLAGKDPAMRQVTLLFTDDTEQPVRFRK